MVTPWRLRASISLRAATTVNPLVLKLAMPKRSAIPGVE
jgi:hypothetical protein